jgi:teichuronic acid biosynthesis glycosyltransferase TuaH
VGWDDFPGTDRRLGTALGAYVPVIWVESPHRRAGRGWWRRRPPAVERVARAVTRLRVPAPPGFSRWPMRWLAERLQRATVLRNLPAGGRLTAFVVANPATPFPRGIAAPKILYVTDDWVAGAGIMGMDRRRVAAALRRSCRDADAIGAVSPTLALRLDELRGAPPGFTAVIPNGAPAVSERTVGPRPAVAGVLGQLNERLDLELLEAVADAGIPILLIGPRYDRGPVFGGRLDRLLAHPLVDWAGEVPPDRVAAELDRIGVGLTPYAVDAFNEASFPLKTLDYLAAGVAVVTTDLPASRWIGGAQVAVAADREEFVAAVRIALARRDDPGVRRACRDLARAHGWDQRARAVLELAGMPQPSPAVAEGLRS